MGVHLPSVPNVFTIVAVGHDRHFLSRLDRVSREHVELALGLYRDAELVSHILEHAGVPEGAPRIAVSLGYSEDGPFVIVDRAGHFITCLGVGMLPFSTPIVRRGRLDEIAEHVSKLQDRMRVAKRLAPGGELGELLKLVTESGDNVSREEIYSLFAVNPIAAPIMLKMMLELSISLQKSLHRILGIHRVGPEHERLLRLYWESSWACAHLALLCGVQCPEGYPDPLPKLDGAEPRTWLSRITTAQGLLPGAIRGAWAASIAGERVFEHYERNYREADRKEPIIEAMLVLAAMAMRTPSLMKDAKRVLGQPPGLDGPAAGIWNEHHAAMVREIYEILDDPESASLLDQDARKYVHTCGEALPYGSTAHFMWEHEVPLTIARPMLGMAPLPILARACDILMGMRLLSWAVRVPGEDLYPPFDYLRGLRCSWSLDRGRELVETTQLSFQRGESVSPPRPPGPNQPCSCGSGKKYKKCCWKKQLAN